jgi:hypothetical protein
MWARRIFPRVDARRQSRRNPYADGSAHDCRFDLSKDEASLGRCEAKPKLEDADSFTDLAVASRVLPRGQASIVEGAAPVLNITV